MTERIDHAAEARRWATSGATPPILPVHAEDPSILGARQIELANAQLHATLALVEQQRIANLIALFRLNNMDAEDFSKAGVVYSQVLAEIKEGLNL